MSMPQGLNKPTPIDVSRRIRTWIIACVSFSFLASAALMWLVGVIANAIKY